MREVRFSSIQSVQIEPRVISRFFVRNDFGQGRDLSCVVGKMFDDMNENRQACFVKPLNVVFFFQEIGR